LDLEKKNKFLELRSQVKELHFCLESMVEVGAIVHNANRLAQTISDSKFRRFCLGELRPLNTDELYFMYRNKDERSFTNAKLELLQILKDCSVGQRGS
jgi:hypothetical protein